MAAYAAVVSLLNTVYHIQNHPRLSTSLDKKQIESLCEKVGFLQDFLKWYSHGGREEAQVEMERQITYAASAAANLIESHVAGQILGGSTRHSSTSLRGLQRVIEDLDSIKKKVMEFGDLRAVQDQPPPIYSEKPISSSTRAPPSGKTNIVGFEEEHMQILERLTEGQPSRQVIPIVGMGGIGKTTLATSVYDDPTVMLHFDIRIWITVSQERTLRDLFLQIPICQREQKRSEGLVTDSQLGEMLYKSLFDRRYLIVLDDMWSIETWDNISIFFPDNDNKSRILVTTRLSNEAVHFGSGSFKVKFLDKDESWNLFCQNTFNGEACPPELEDIGKKIVQKCKGLPLSIIVIGGLLAKSHRTLKHLESVYKDINSILNSGHEEHCLNVLSLSYSHLPTHLKPCYLYMGIFPEDLEIQVSLLIQIWIAVGLIEPNKDKSLEEVAEDYLKDLVDRNIILVRKWGSNGKIRTCYIHDLLRDLCLKIAQKEELFHVLKEFDSPRIICGMCCIVSQGNKSWRPFSPVAYSQISVDELQMFGGGRMALFKYGLKLQVLNNVYIISYEDIFQQVNLRFISLKSDGIFGLPSSVSQLWNLQTLIFHAKKEVYAPVEIWEMQQLRHVDFWCIHLPQPPTTFAGDEDIPILKNLHTLMKAVVCFSWSEEALKRIPCIKKMKIQYRYTSQFLDAADYRIYNQFQQLESLHVDFPFNASKLRCPYSLKKITLTRFHLCWDDLAMFGWLPHLEVLKLKGYRSEISGTEWNPIEGGFPALKSLRVDICQGLIYWNADRCHFPVLENLHFDCLHNLDEIPSGIGDIATLKVIFLQHCKASAAISAMKMHEQESFGNEGLAVRVLFMSYNEEKTFRADVKLQGITSNNFHIELEISDHLNDAVLRQDEVYKLAAMKVQHAFREYKWNLRFADGWKGWKLQSAAGWLEAAKWNLRWKPRFSVRRISGHLDNGVLGKLCKDAIREIAATKIQCGFRCYMKRQHPRKPHTWKMHAEGFP